MPVVLLGDALGQLFQTLMPYVIEFIIEPDEMSASLRGCVVSNRINVDALDGRWRNVVCVFWPSEKREVQAPDLAVHKHSS